MFIVLLNNIVNASNHTKHVSLRNQKCVMNTVELHNYPLAVKLGRCVGSCDKSSKKFE